MKVRNTMTYLIVVVVLIIIGIVLYDFTRGTVFISPERDKVKSILIKDETRPYPYSVTLSKSAVVNGVPLYEFKFLNNGNLYIESISINFVFFDDNEVIGVEIKEFLDIPAKMFIEEMISLNNGNLFDKCNWFVVEVITQK